MIRAVITGNLRASLEREVKQTATALRAAVQRAGTEVQSELRAQARAARFSDQGRSIANTWRLQTYPRAGVGAQTFRPAALVFSKMPTVVHAFEEGATVLPQEGGFLAIPLPAAGRGPRGKRMTPRLFEQRTGLRLRLVYRRGRPSLLVVDNARLGRAGVVRANTGISRARQGRATFTRIAGRTTVPVFVLLPRVKLPKLLDVRGVAARASSRLAAAVAAEFSRMPSVIPETR